MPPKQRGGGKKKKGRKEEKAAKEKNDGAGGSGGGGAGGGSAAVDDPYALIKVCRGDESGDVHEARDLIARGINIDEQNEHQGTALMFAVANNHIEIVQELVRAGAALDVQDKWGHTALMDAAMENRIEISKELVRAGAALDVQGKKGKTALQCAQEWVHTDIVAILEEATQGRREAAGEGKARGSDTKAKNDAGSADGGGAGGRSAGVDDPKALINLCCRRDGSGDVGEARDLIARGINIDEQSEYGTTALMHAIANNRIVIVK